MSTLYVQSPTLYLAGSGVVIGATSITLTNLTDIYGNVLTMANFGSLGYITLEPDTVNAEAATFTGVTANANGTYTLTGVKTALAVSPYTQTSGLVRNHSGGTKVVVTDNVAWWNTFANKANDETITGRWGSATVPSSGNDYTNKTYVDGVAIAGAPDSSTTTKGITKMSVAPVSATSPIAVGDNDGRVPTQSENDALVGDNTDIAVGSGNKFVTQTGLQKNAEKYAVDTSGSSTAYTITLSPAPTSLTTGMVIYAKIVNTNTTATPTLNVNGLGAKTIVKFTSTPVAINEIQANQFCKFIYDGTNFVIQPDSSLPLVASASANLKLSADTERSTNSATSLTLVKQIRMAYSGTVRVAHQMKASPATTADVQSKIYLNGVAVGTLRATQNGTYQSYTEDIVVGMGDLVQLYYDTSSSPTVTCYVNNFRISFDLTIGGDGIVVTD